MGWLTGKESIDPANADATTTTTTTTVQERSPAELIADSLRPFTDQFTALNQRLAAIEENSRPKQTTTPTELTSVYEDENAAFQQRLTPVVLRQLELEARVVTADIKREYERMGFGEMWDQFSEEINSILFSSPLVTADGKALRGDPAYIRNTVDMVLGRAARTKGLRFNGKDQTFFLESAGGSAGNGAETPTNDGLTDKQRKVFQRMGISPTEGKSTLDKLTFIN